MNIAIIGSGISGLIAAYLLARRHSVQVFEAADYIGGHTHTIDVKESGRMLPVDTGFIVFNELNYPNLCRLFEALGVASRNSDMSFSVRCEHSGLEYNGSTFASLFAQKSNLLNPPFWAMLRDILAFHKDAYRALKNGLSEQLSITDFVQQHAYGRLFFSHYLLPLGASIWSCPTDYFRVFPARFVLEFMANHRLLQINGRPQWKTVVGGSRSYITPLTRTFADRIHLKARIVRVKRQAKSVELTTANGATQHFDEVVIATHANQALSILAEPEADERELLQSFPYQRNEVTVHTDTGLLPRSPQAWASWNYYLPANNSEQATLTYNMNLLQGLNSAQTYCVSLNQSAHIDAKHIVRRIPYSHPQFGPGVLAAQARHPEMIRRRRLSYCGAYWGHGFHEDGLRSALAVGEAFEETVFP